VSSAAGKSQATLVCAAVAGTVAQAMVAWAMRLLGSRKIRIRMGFVLLCIATTLALPQQSPEEGNNPNPTTEESRQQRVESRYRFDGEQVIGQIATATESALASLQNNRGLNNFGTTVSAFFLIALMVWALVRSLASGRGFGDVIGEWVPIFVSFAVVWLFLDKNAGRLIVGTMDSIASAIGGSPWNSLGSAIREAAYPIFRSMAAVLSTPDIKADNMVWYEKLVWVATAVPLWIGTWIAKGVSMLLLTLSAVAVIATVIMAFISVELVLALAPAMVPFLMFRPMSWLFDSWLRFLLGACMMKVVGAFLLGAVAQIMTAGATLAQQIATETSGRVGAIDAAQLDIVLHGMMLVMTLLGTLLMVQAPSIATGLIAGGASGSGFSGIRAVTQQSPGSRVTSGTISGTAAGAGRAAGAGVAAARQANAARQGVAHAQAGVPLNPAHSTNPGVQRAYATAHRGATWSHATGFHGPPTPNRTVPPPPPPPSPPTPP
jgi:type IV secretion system protein TrbL